MTYIQKILASSSILLFLLTWTFSINAATLQVGPGKQFASLNAVQTIVKPGDVVQVYGDATYPGNVWFKVHGKADNPIIIRGIAVNGKRPVLSGGEVGSGGLDGWTVLFAGDFYTFEGFDVTAGAKYCIINKAHGTTIRDSVIHDCPNHGILGTDSESGSLTIEYCEVHHCGSGEGKHQLYIATDETAHPKSVFRLQHCYIHDGLGGNNVKTRAERNEIYFNWIEGAAFHELDLIGPDGQEENLAREDSDVVGNVIIKKSKWQLARIGGDGTGSTFGRYRFVNNTFIMSDLSLIGIRLQYELESLELHNNVFYRPGGLDTTFIKRSDPFGPDPVVSGTNNWIGDNFLEIPNGIIQPIRGNAPGFADINTFDFRPIDSSPLVDQGASLKSLSGPYPFPNPLEDPLYLPPPRRMLAVNSAVLHPIAGKSIDIGAYEFGSVIDGGITVDSGVVDSGSVIDSGAVIGSGNVIDSSTITDSGNVDSAVDSNNQDVRNDSTIDAGKRDAAKDSGSKPTIDEEEPGCSCGLVGGSNSAAGGIMFLTILCVWVLTKIR